MVSKVSCCCVIMVVKEDSQSTAEDIPKYFEQKMDEMVVVVDLLLVVHCTILPANGLFSTKILSCFFLASRHITSVRKEVCMHATSKTVGQALQAESTLAKIPTISQKLRYVHTLFSYMWIRLQRE